MAYKLILAAFAATALAAPVEERQSCSNGVWYVYESQLQQHLLTMK
jgi:hypothetical protein